MTEVCTQCHGPGLFGAAFTHIDATFSAPPVAPKLGNLPSSLFMQQAWPHLSPVDQFTLMHLQK